MRLSFALPLSLTLAALVGCSPKQAPNTVPVTTTPTKSAPAWIDNEEIPDGLAAMGSAQPNPMGDKAMQRTIAIADARAKLAAKMKIRVQNVFSQLNQDVTTAASDGSKKPVRNEAMNRVYENVSRQIVDQEMVGTSTRSFWTDPADGTLYVHVVMTNDVLDRAVAATTRKEIHKEVEQGEKSLEHALDKLDAAIAASEPK